MPVILNLALLVALWPCIALSESPWNLRGRLQALIGHMPGTPSHNDPHLELYLQTSNGSHYALVLPNRLADKFDASSMAGADVDVLVTSAEPGDRPHHLHLIEVPTLTPAGDGSVSSSGQLRLRGLQQMVGGASHAPLGSIRIIVFIMHLSTLCGTAGPATTPQVGHSLN